MAAISGSRYNLQSGLQPQGYPVALDATGTYFVDQSGKPCFGCGDAPQYLIEQLSTSYIDFYLSDRAARGMNLLWMIAADKLYQSNPPNNFYGEAPFSGPDFTNFNEAYWSRVDNVMQRCLVYGQTVLFMPAFIGLSATEGYYSDFYNQTTAVIQGYGTFLGNRYGGFPNLIWLLGGDADPNNAASYAALKTFALAIKAADVGDHLMTLEASRHLENGGAVAPNGGYSSVDAHILAYGSVQSWLTLNWVYQTQPTIVSGAQRCYSQGLSCMLGEDVYEGNGVTPQQIRGEGYGSVLGGCTLGRIGGNAAIWPFGSANSGDPATQTLSPWQGQLASPGSVGQQLLGNLFRSIAHQKLVPDIANVVMTVGAAGGANCARTNDGRSIVAYLPVSLTITIDMTKIIDSGGLANAYWFNPRSGEATFIGQIATTATHNFTSPDANDWVLVLNSAAANLRVPGA